ncbi:MAG TPA: alpha-ketoglutarate-dependent dioxygenase AlkB [Salinimicrobium sp.]|nr:alpha-ketoglutarate-dependent dioxygenase AlkB [Salinimicrobium sp.]
MNLFGAENIQENLLPEGGTLIYYGKILSAAEAENYFKILMETVPWKNDEMVIFGKRIVTSRKIAWFANENTSYTYSNTTKQAFPWTKELLELKKRVEEISKTQFNSCLLNLYHSGEEGLGWHSDNEKTLGENPIIASLSLGAERKFMLKHKISKKNISLTPENGSLLVMKDETQENWLHSLPKTKKVKTPRINLTFREMI